MNIAVCIKRVPDTSEAEVRIAPTGRDIIKDRLAFTINEADNYAVEEALLQKEKLGGEVTVVSVGQTQAEEVLRMAMAKGAGAAVRIDDTGLAEADGIGLAQVLAAWFRPRSFDIIMTGCVATDDGNSQVGPALAALLDRPHATYVTKLAVANGKAEVKRELEGGLLDVRELNLPCVITIQTGGNSPRYASIMGIKRAGARPIEQSNLAALAAEPTVRTRLQRLSIPEVAGAAQLFEGTPDEKAQQLAALLKTRGVV